METDKVLRLKCGLFFFAFSSGFIIWALSPHFTGKVIPWDTKGYYWISFIIAGSVTGFFGHRLFWFWPLVLYLGQSAYILVYAFTHVGTNVGFYWPLGLVFGLLSLVPGFIGSIIGLLLRSFIADKSEGTGPV